MHGHVLNAHMEAFSHPHTGHDEERERWKKFFFSKNVSRQCFEEKPFRTNYSSNFFSKVQNLTVFNCLQDSNSIFPHGNWLLSTLCNIVWHNVDLFNSSLLSATTCSDAWIVAML